MTVKIFVNGDMKAKGSTSAQYGMVTVSSP
jgi:hypothetical protein